MQDAGVEDDTVDQILTMLESSKQDVKRGENIELAPSSSFGDAPTAAELGTHAGKAHHHVVEAMSQMVEGLGKYYENVRVFREDVHETDDVVATDLSRTASTVVDFSPALACTAPTDFSSNTSCEMPEGDQ
jgi:hypothetical protein